MGQHISKQTAWDIPKTWLDALNNRIENDCNNGSFVQNLMKNPGHLDKHDNKTTIELLDRGLIEQPVEFAMSTFNDNTPDETLLRLEMAMGIVIDKQPEFLSTLTTSNLPKRWSTDVAFDDSYADMFPIMHRGVYIDHRGRIRETESNVTRLVFERNDYAPYGFKLITAFPLTDPNKIINRDLGCKPTIRPTGRDLSQDIKQTDFYKNALPERQAHLRLAAQPFPQELTSLHYMPGKDGYSPSISADFNIGDHKCLRVYVNENKTTLHERHRNKTTSRWERAKCTTIDGTRKIIDLNIARYRLCFAEMFPTAEAFVTKMENELHPDRQRQNALAQAHTTAKTTFRQTQQPSESPKQINIDARRIPDQSLLPQCPNGNTDGSNFNF